MNTGPFMSYQRSFFLLQNGFIDIILFFMTHLLILLSPCKLYLYTIQIPAVIFRTPEIVTQ